MTKIWTDAELFARYQALGSMRAVTRETGVPNTSLRRKLSNWVDKKDGVGQIGYFQTETMPLPPEGEVFRYIVTCAQNNTNINLLTWQSLQRIAEFYKAKLLIARFTYDKRVSLEKNSQAEGVWYAPEIAPYVCDKRVQLAPNLLFCGEMNILPTAVRPLSGLHAYTGRDSGIFPHVKLAMESVASGRFEGTKLNYTTGTVTLRNYIKKKAGFKADFHHCYGGLLVEVNSAGEWWVRQLNADSEGGIFDLDNYFTPTHNTSSCQVHAVTWGDIHLPSLSIVQHRVVEDMTRALQPKFHFVHDVLDFRARSHHDRDNPHERFKRWVAAGDCVKTEVATVATWLGNLKRLATQSRADSEIIVVDSNHDRAFEKWLRDGDYKKDPVNAVYFLKAQLAYYHAMQAEDKNFHLLEWACGLKPGLVRFLREDESFVICFDKNGGIECGMHGHLGPNGTRPTTQSFAKMGRKANVAHTHTAAIIDGVYCAGITGALDQTYNKGPSTWSHTHTVTYKNGKRVQITVWNGKWRA